MKTLFQANELDEVATFLKQGKVIAIPTETVYGLAGDLRHETAIKHIFTLKNRPINHPLIIHIADLAELSEYTTDVPDYVVALLQAFWPGPLTIVVNKSKRVSDVVTGGQKTVAIRLPAHPLARALIGKVGSALAAPSANRFGHISPTLASHVLEEFGAKVSVIDGGPCLIGIESTILDVSQASACAILRPGMISREDIEKILGKNILVTGKGSLKVSGTHEQHYAPSKANYLIQESIELEKLSEKYQGKIYFLWFSDRYAGSAFSGYRMSKNPAVYAQTFYEQLRLAESSDCEAIVIEAPPQDDFWSGVFDRVLKSTAKNRPLYCYMTN